MAHGRKCRLASMHGRSGRQLSPPFSTRWLVATLFLTLSSVLPLALSQHDSSTGLQASQAANTLQSVPRFGRPTELPNFFDGLLESEGEVEFDQAEWEDYIVGALYHGVSHISQGF